MEAAGRGERRNRIDRDSLGLEGGVGDGLIPHVGGGGAIRPNEDEERERIGIDLGRTNPQDAWSALSTAPTDSTRADRADREARAARVAPGTEHEEREEGKAMIKGGVTGGGGGKAFFGPGQQASGGDRASFELDSGSGDNRSGSDVGGRGGGDGRPPHGAHAQAVHATGIGRDRGTGERNGTGVTFRGETGVVCEQFAEGIG